MGVLPKLQEIVKLFRSVQEPKAKYQQLLFYSKNLKQLETQFKTRENKVDGCVSQHDQLMTDVVDQVLKCSDALYSAAPYQYSLYSRCLAYSMDMLQQSLTPSRNNGFLNLFELMQKKALELFLEAEKTDKELKIGSGGGENSTGGLSSEVDVDENGTNSGGLGSRGMRIREKLEKELRPIELEAEDISYQHAGRAGGRGSDGETHFNVKIVSEKFKGKSLVKREIDLWFVTKVVGQWTSCIVDCREDTI
ncbi:hypothetical protein QYF36_001454 [Acer negundo]|nr:hypothetical protein QYF36_001454 [Acer negundo]